MLSNWFGCFQSNWVESSASTSSIQLGEVWDRYRLRHAAVHLGWVGLMYSQATVSLCCHLHNFGELCPSGTVTLVGPVRLKWCFRNLWGLVVFGFHSRGSCPLRPLSLSSHRASLPLAGEVFLKIAPLKLYEAKGASWVTLSLLWFPFTPSFWLVCLITTPRVPLS